MAGDDLRSDFMKQWIVFPPMLKWPLTRFLEWYDTMKPIFIANLEDVADLETGKEDVGVAADLIADHLGDAPHVDAFTKAEADIRDMVLSVGMVDRPVLTDHHDGTFTVGAFDVIVYLNPQYDGHPEQFTIPARTYTGLPNQWIGYVIADYNGGGPIQRVTTDVGEIDNITKCRVFTAMVGNTGIHYFWWGDTGKAAIDHIRQRFLLTTGFTRESGFGLSATAFDPITPTVGGRVRLESGIVWRGISSTALNQVYPPDTDPGGNGEIDFYWRKAAPGEWNETHPDQYDREHYDDGSGTLAHVTADGNHYAVNWVYRLVQDDEDTLAIVPGQDDYTLTEAQDSQPPGDVPAHVAAFGWLVGRIIISPTSDTPEAVESVFDTAFAGAVATDHESLTNRLGAGPSGAFHLTEDLHDAAAGAGGAPNATNKFMTEDVTYTKTETDLGISQKRNAGLLADPTYTLVGDGTIVVDPVTAVLFDNTDFDGPPAVYAIAGDTFDPPDDSQSYVVADYNGGTPIMRLLSGVDLPLINESTILPIVTLWRHGIYTEVLPWDSMAKGLANKLHLVRVKTTRFLRERGFGLSVSPGRVVNIAEGRAWYGAQHVDKIACSSSGPATMITYYYDVPGHIAQRTDTQFNNSQYNNPATGGLTTLTDGRYAVHWVYRCLAADNNVIETMIGGGDYTLTEAQDSQPPPPSGDIQVTAMLVGRIITKKGESTPTMVQSAFDVQFIGCNSIPHNEQIGLQGGAPDDYYHLTAAELAHLPSHDQKAALAGTSGTPSSTNKYVTTEDPRLDDARPADGGNADTVGGFYPNAFDAAGAASSAVSAHDSAVSPHPGKFDVAGAAAGAVGSHEGTYAHGDLPSSGEKAALPGTYGTPGAGNKYVTDTDPRMTPVKFMATANGVANDGTANQVSVVGTGVGSMTLPANTLSAGKSVRIMASGFLTRGGNIPLTIRIKIGGDTMLTFAFTPSAGSNLGWHIPPILITCRTAGAAGVAKAIAQGFLVSNTTLVQATVNTAPVGTSLDTTASQLVEVTAQWNSGNVNNTVTCTNLEMAIEG